MKVRGSITGKLTAFGVSMLAFGCMTSGTGGATAEALPPCQVETDQSRDWRQVSTDVISFCVPAGWTARGQTQWTGRGGSIRWGTGPQVAGSRPGQGSLRQETRNTEVIGGFPAELWVFRIGDEFHTGAEWLTPREVHLRGIATSEAAAELHMDIFRTARPGGSDQG